MKKILIVNYRYFVSGGPERYMFSVKNEFEKRGYEVVVFSTSHDRNIESEYSEYFTPSIGNGNEIFLGETKMTIPVLLRTLSRQFYSLRVRKDLDRLIKKEKPGICYLLHHNNILSPSVIDACRMNNVPVVHRLSDYYLMCAGAVLYSDGEYCNKCKKSLLNIIKNRCVRNSFPKSVLKCAAYYFHRWIKIYDKIDAYVCTNPYMVEELKSFGMLNKRVEVISTFACENDVSLKKEKKDSRFTYIYAGDFSTEKGVYDFIRAIALVKNRTKKQFSVIMLGGRMKHEIEKVKLCIEENNLEDTVSRYEFLDKTTLNEMYRTSDVSVIPARIAENLPNAILESLSFELPVVIPDFGSFKFIDDSVSYKYETGNVESLAGVLKYLLENENDCLKKKNACKNYLSEKHSVEKHMNQLVSLFSDVVDRYELS